MIAKKTETAMVKFFFTDEEKVKLAEKQSASTIRSGELEAELDSIKRDYKSRIETANLEAVRCAHKVKDGYEMRRVECHVERDFRTHIIKFVNPENGELLEERPMSIDERNQMSLVD